MQVVGVQVDGAIGYGFIQQFPGGLFAAQGTVEPPGPQNSSGAGAVGCLLKAALKISKGR